ncbi:MAG TPA: LytTR family transcriptional regulator [Ruminococcaceae bacterium]|nr:LytTR family transcriptional regulator [Oscillospiraceae bacterium]HCA28559.1 LytTR family transcriptional regulator [Oscillospiraceae bacterium]
MRIRIEVVDDLTEDEVLIRCSRVNDTVNKIHHFILEQSQSGSKLIFYKQNQEFYILLEEVLFFETDGEQVYAHTKNDSYRIKYRLYELEEILPKCFVRAAKSTIINITHIYSITRNLTSSSLVRFINSHKQVYVSRRYYQGLKQRMNERRSI